MPYSSSKENSTSNPCSILSSTRRFCHLVFVRSQDHDSIDRVKFTKGQHIFSHKITTMKFTTLSTFLLAIIVQGIYAASTRGGHHKEKAPSRGLEDVIENPCLYTKCSSSAPVCVINSEGNSQCVEDVCSDLSCNEGYQCFPKVEQCKGGPCPPIAECIKNPCSETNVCPMDVGCTLDTSLRPVCIAFPGGFNSICIATTCPIEQPICVESEDGTPKCIADPCTQGDLVCNAASTCEVDSSGKPYCKPLPGNPGNPFTSCSELICNAASTCEINEKGEAYCKPLPGNPGNIIKPKWWSQIKKSFKGKGLDQCSGQRGIAPVHGSKCSSKKAGKTCFFGNQKCKVIGSFPDTRCDCIKGKWKCNKKLKCLTSKNETFK